MNGTAIAFLAFVVAVAASVGGIAALRLDARPAVRVAVGLPLWLVYVGTLSASGLIADATRRPPAILAIVVPALLFVVLGVGRSREATRIARALPLALPIGFQGFRVGVELFLHALHGEGLVPRMLTYDGANLDVWIGLSAPLAAWISARGRAGLRIAFAWNAIGLLVLGNVVVRSALTSPGPLHLLQAESLNLATGIFPYTFIAGFLAPLAVTLHVLAMRAIAARLAASTDPKGIPA